MILNEDEVKKLFDEEIKKQLTWVVNTCIDERIKKFIQIKVNHAHTDAYFESLIDEAIEKKITESMPKFNEEYLEKISKDITNNIADKVSKNMIEELRYALCRSDDDDDDDDEI